jgi:hypothetical protein
MSKKIDEDKPVDLPAVKAKVESAQTVDTSRICDKCKSNKVRIIANHSGHRAVCLECQNWWSLSMAAPMLVSGNLYQRGPSKRTISETDFSLAFEDLDDIYDPSKR